MSVRHIDFLKIKPSKCLVVEIRPVRCYIETSSGMTKTAKWMSYEHWKELRILLNDITTSYEESKMIGSTEEIKCNEHKMKDGQLIKIGYMFVAHNAYKCQFLMPREDATWTDDENEDEDEEYQTMRDKGGKYRALIPCAERLVVSVRLQNQTSSLKSPADKELFKALDSSFVVTNTISDYFPSSQKKCVDSESSVLQSQHDEQNELKNMIGNHKQRTKFPHSDCNHRKERLQNRSIFESSSEESTSHNEAPVFRHLSQIHRLCSSTSDFYPSFKGIDFDSTRCHGESMGFTEEGIRKEKKSDEDSDNLELNPRIDHLRECKSKLTRVTISELTEKLEDAHEYLRGIINEKIFSEKHQIFKKNCNEIGSLLSIEVYAVFDEEQSEFVIDLMRQKYSEKLQSAIKNKNVRRQYIWKVLVPSFFIKLTMDILNITSEKEAQNQLMEICMNFAD